MLVTSDVRGGRVCDVWVPVSLATPQADTNAVLSKVAIKLETAAQKVVVESGVTEQKEELGTEELDAVVELDTEDMAKLEKDISDEMDRWGTVSREDDEAAAEAEEVAELEAEVSKWEERVAQREAELAHE